MNYNDADHVCKVGTCNKIFQTDPKTKRKTVKWSAHHLLYIHIKKYHTDNDNKVSFACHSKCKFVCKII